METHGYIIPFWPSGRLGPDTAAIYETLLAASVLSFRACSGAEPDLLVVDVEGSLSHPTREAIKPLCRIWSGWELGTAIPWERNCFNKLLALANSPFRETALLDADLIWAAGAGDVWAGVASQIAGVFCENYHRGARICACLTVCRDREAPRAAMALRRELYRPNSDEAAWGLAVERELVSRQMLAARWAFDGRALLGPGPGPFHNWERRATYTGFGEWLVDGAHIRSFHLSGIKHRALCDPRVAQYLERCAEVVRP
jgi:hypothetical protein